MTDLCGDEGCPQHGTPHVCVGASAVTPQDGKLAELLEETLSTLRHAHIFITSRERMHIDGVALYDDNIEHLKAYAATLPRADRGVGS